MCRFLAYKGRELFLSDLLTRLQHSLIHQSFKAVEREEPLNGDGFGVGWSATKIDPEPCVFTSIRPAWSDLNLHRLSEKVQSTCVFAHVRAASPGSIVTQTNCHPFHKGRFLWMHNGTIEGFGGVRRGLRESLCDEAEAMIQGTTDSEHLFALFVHELGGTELPPTTHALAEAMKSTLRRVIGWAEAGSTPEDSTCNFAVTDGESIVATRYCTGAGRPAPSLYLAIGDRFERTDGVYRMLPVRSEPRAILLASEPLTEVRTDWHPIPDDHLVTITPELDVDVWPIA